MATWPTVLPQSPLIEGFSDTPQDSVLRSKMDGYTKQRNRYTAALSDVEESYLLTPAQYDALVTFYTSILGNGALDFTKPNPETGTNSIYRFVDVYSGKFDGVKYKVKIKLERLP